MRPFNSCCFSGGADGTQGSFKSMPGHGNPRLAGHGAQCTRLLHGAPFQGCSASRSGLRNPGQLARGAVRVWVGTGLAPILQSEFIVALKRTPNGVDVRVAEGVARNPRRGFKRQRTGIRGTGFSREEGSSTCTSALAVSAASRLKPVPQEMHLPTDLHLPCGCIRSVGGPAHASNQSSWKRAVLSLSARLPLLRVSAA